MSTDTFPWFRVRRGGRASSQVRNALRCEVSYDFEPEAWDALAREHGGSVFHSHGWAQAQCHAYGGRPLFVRWLDDRGQIVAVATGTQRPSPESPLGRVISFARFQSPPATRGHAADFAASLLEWARERSVAEMQLRSSDGVGRNWSERLDHPTPRIEFPLEPGTRAELRSRMRQGTRYSIKRAERLGIETQAAADHRSIADFVALHAATLARLRRRKGHEVSSRVDPDRLKNWIDFLVKRGRVKLYLAFEANNVIAGCLFGIFDTSAYYSLNAASERALQVGATPLLLWRALAEFSDAGYGRLNLGGVPATASDPTSLDHGLYEFKRGLGANPALCTGGVSTLKPLRLATARFARRLVHGVGR